MSSNSITITAQSREITGTNKVRNLRKNEMVPAVIYGNEAEVQKVNIPLNAVSYTHLTLPTISDV